MSGEEDAKYKVTKRVYGRWKDEISKPRLKGGISYEESFQTLVNICMTCPLEEREKNIEMLFYSTPTSWKDEELWEALEECKETVEYTQPVIFCGIEIDAGVIPPKVWTQVEIHWEELFNAIIDCANRRNLLIPMERAEVFAEKE